MSHTWIRSFPGAFLTIAMMAALGACSGTEKHAASAHSAAPHWDYGAEHGPAAWGSMDPDYVACAEGRSQSPIDIPSIAAASNDPGQGSVALAVGPERITRIVNNGHTIQVDFEGAGSVTVGDRRHALVQLHFHSPSEHTVDGRPFPMEVHLVHRSDDGKLAVVGVLIAEGSPNSALNAVWVDLPGQTGQEVRPPDSALDVNGLLPAERTAYRYEGSLTTPPCSEGVHWIVMKTPITLSAEQIARFREIIHDNSRPTQPLNNRAVSQAPMP